MPPHVYEPAKPVSYWELIEPMHASRLAFAASVISIMEAISGIEPLL